MNKMIAKTIVRVENSTSESFYQKSLKVPEVNENWPRKLWDMVRDAKDGSHTLQDALIEEVDLDKDMLDLEIGSLYGDRGIEVTIDRQDETLQELP